MSRDTTINTTSSSPDQDQKPQGTLGATVDERRRDSETPFFSVSLWLSGRRKLKVVPLRNTVSTEHLTDREPDDDDDILPPTTFPSNNTVSESKPSLSDFKASMHILKANVGTGVLALPSAIRDAGLMFGSLSIVVVALVVTHSMHLLLESTQYLRRIHATKRRAAKARSAATTRTTSLSTEEPPVDDNDEVPFALDEADDIRLDYYETVRMTLDCAPAPWNRWGWLANLLNVYLMIGQLGFLAVYQLFVAQNTKYMVDFFQLKNAPGINIYLLAVFAFILPLVFVKTLDKLAVVSSLANILGMSGLGIVLAYCLQDLGPVVELPLIRGMQTLPLAFGVIVSSFESVSVLLPIENQMRHPDHLLGVFGVLSVTMTVVSSIYLTVGFYGYLRFGEGVEGAVIYNVPMSPWIYGLAKPMYTISIFISYTLQFYVIFTIFWKILVPYLHSRRSFQLGDALLRVGIVTFALLLSILVPKVELLISFVGALASSSIVLIFPPLVHSINTWQCCGDSRRTRFIIAKNVLIIAFGVFGAILGIDTSLMAIIELF